MKTKISRLIYVALLYIIALVLSWVNLRRIYVDDPIPFLESVQISLIYGFIALPLSANHMIQNIGPSGVIPIAGMPDLFLVGVILSLIFIVSLLFFILKGNKTAGCFATLYLLLACPYWGYYSFGLSGI